MPASSIGMFVCDPAGLIRWWSDGAAGLFGYPTGEALGHPLRELLAPASDALDDQGPQPWNVRTRDGQRTTFWRAVSVLENAAGERLSLQVVWRQSDGDTGADARRSAECAGALAARIAQDFSRLLSPVIGSIILLEEDLSDEHAAHRRVVAARQAAEEARGFAQRLLALDPKRKMAPAPCDLAQVVRELMPELVAALPSSVELVAELDGSREPGADAVSAVCVDKKLIGHAVAQLVLNATEAMPCGGVLTLALSNVDSADNAAGARELPSGRWVRLEVRDQGKGMDEVLLKHAFAPFVTTKSPGCGVGLGLSIAQAIVGQHGGFLDASSRPGQGATVAIYLPSCGALPDNSSVDSSAKPTGAATPTDAIKANILLVEDNAMVRRSIEATLKGLGYGVVAVSNGDACIQAVNTATAPIDLLITDVVMPEMSGKELIERLRAIQSTLPVLFMSGYDRSTLASRRQSVAAEHFLQKPFDCEDLSAAVVRAMADRKGKSPD